MLGKLEHESNAFAPMLVSVLGRFIATSVVLLLKAEPPKPVIYRTSTPLKNTHV